MDTANLGVDAVVVPGRGYVFAVEADAKEAVGDEAEVVIARGGGGEVGLPKDGQRTDADSGSGNGRDAEVENRIDARGKRGGAAGVVNVAEVEFGEVDADPGL